jgi:hypothetical protein
MAFEPKVAIDHFAIRLGENWHGESELTDAGPHPIDRLVVLAGIALVGLQPFDRPVFDAEPRPHFDVLRYWIVLGRHTSSLPPRQARL